MDSVSNTIELLPLGIKLSYAIASNDNYYAMLSSKSKDVWKELGLVDIDEFNSAMLSAAFAVMFYRKPMNFYLEGGTLTATLLEVEEKEIKFTVNNGSMELHKMNIDSSIFRKLIGDMSLSIFSMLTKAGFIGTLQSFIGAPRIYFYVSD